MGYPVIFYISSFFIIIFKASEHVCLSKINSNKLRKLSKTFLLHLSAISSPLPHLHPAPPVFLAKIYLFFKAWLRCHFLVKLSLRLLISQPQG